MSASQFSFNWYAQTIPTEVYNTSAASGTYQASSTNYKKLHVLCSEVDIYINSGTGSSVSVTTSNGFYVFAGTQIYFHPAEGKESLGWVTKSGAAGRTSIAIVSA